MPLCTIDSRHTSFKNGAKAATKRHRSFPDALKQILEKIEADPMQVGDQIKCADVNCHVRKVRIGCKKENLSPSAGYRLIFQVASEEDKVFVRLLDIYYKQHQADIEADAVKRLIDLSPPFESQSTQLEAEPNSDGL